MKNEILTFINNEVRLDVNVSPSEDTVWLSLTDMCLLFDRDKSVISRHIKSVISENNLDVNQVVAKNATTGNDGKTYIVSFDNLDVIIPLGYKVRSSNAKLSKKDVIDFNSQYGDCSTFLNDKYHDRFLIIE